MRMKFLSVAIGVLTSAMVIPTQAAIIDFTGGTVYFLDGTSRVTDTTWSSNVTNGWSEVDYYVEDGFVLDFVGGGGIIGDYYGGGNDVIHAHWSSGDFGTVTSIDVYREDGQAFDLNYFEMTSNTDTGGAAASGNELAYMTGYDGNGAVAPSLLLPTDDWGWTGANPQVFLDSDYDAITSFSFTVGNEVDCFGMDMFYINEDAPPHNDPVPEPATMLLFGAGLIGLVGYSRKRSKKS